VVRLFNLIFAGGHPVLVFNCKLFASEHIVKLLEVNKKFVAIDKAIGENSFNVIAICFGKLFI